MLDVKLMYMMHLASPYLSPFSDNKGMIIIIAQQLQLYSSCSYTADAVIQQLQLYSSCSYAAAAAMLHVHSSSNSCNG